MIGVGPPGGAGPFQAAAALLGHVPGTGVLEGVVAATEGGEVAGVGGSAVGGVDGVVGVASPGLDPAAGESAVLVSVLDEAAERRRGSVAVHGDGESGGQVEEDTIPGGGRGEQFTCEAGVDRTVAGEQGGVVVDAGGGGDGDGEVDLTPDAGQRRPVGTMVSGRSGREQQIGEHIGADL